MRARHPIVIHPSAKKKSLNSNHNHIISNKQGHVKRHTRFYRFPTVHETQVLKMLSARWIGFEHIRHPGAIDPLKKKKTTSTFNLKTNEYNQWYSERRPIKRWHVVSCAEPDDRIVKMPFRTDGTGTAYRPCVCGSGGSVRRIGRISIRSPSTNTGRASRPCASDDEL